MPKNALRATPFFDSMNWEHNILRIDVEACDRRDDPLGCRAVYTPRAQKARFTVGASLLAARALRLENAGYAAPMTRQAIALIEERLGHSLPSFAGAGI